MLAVSDLHHTLRQLDWVVAAAGDYEVVVVAGDHLDIGSAVEREIGVLQLDVGEVGTPFLSIRNPPSSSTNKAGEDSRSANTTSPVMNGRRGICSVNRSSSFTRQVWQRRPNELRSGVAPAVGLEVRPRCCDARRWDDGPAAPGREVKWWSH